MEMKKIWMKMVVIGLLAAACPAHANILVELSFQAKMAASDVVIVGTVTAANPGQDGQYDASVTVMTLATLKGRPQAQHIVLTQSRIAEDELQCCDVGSTYVMFLQHIPDSYKLTSVNSRHGMVRIGRADNEPRIEAVPESR
jgi:hypothetical protein